MSDSTTKDYLSMSDDEFDASAMDAMLAEEDREQEGDEPEVVPGDEGEAEEAEGTDSGEEADREENENQEEEYLSEKPNDDDEEDTNTEEEDGDGEEDDSSGSAEGEEESADESQANAEDFFKKITAPFIANGREMQVSDPEDVIRLMKMGANYSKKMAAMKPGLKVLKVLEKNGLLDEKKIGFLVDLHRKDQGAIARLIKDSGVDPMNLEDEESDNYKPSTYTVDDRELALDEVIDRIRDTDAYPKTIKVVSNKWDSASKQTIADNPQLLEVLNNHMASGVYDLISAEMDTQRTLGKLDGLSDLEAYRQVGDAIEARGGFAHLFKTEGKETGKRSAQPSKPASRRGANPDRNGKRRAAGTSRPAPASGAKNEEFNPLSMSDEEFEKQMLSKFI